MSEFFEPTPDVPDDEGMDEEMPPWLHPPASAVPGLMADRRILARAGPVAILLSHVDAYPVGCNLVLRIIGRRPQGMDHRTWLELHESLMGAGFHRTPDASGGEPLRFGLRFADGTKVVADRGFYDHAAAPDTPVLIHRENGGGGRPQRRARPRALGVAAAAPGARRVGVRLAGDGHRAPVRGARRCGGGRRCGPLG